MSTNLTCGSEATAQRLRPRLGLRRADAGMGTAHVPRPTGMPTGQLLDSVLHTPSDIIRQRGNVFRVSAAVDTVHVALYVRTNAVRAKHAVGNAQRGFLITFRLLVLE